MKIFNDIINDYNEYCKRRLIEEFGSCSYEKLDPILIYHRYKIRIIAPKKRKIEESKTITIPDKYMQSYCDIKKDILNGEQLRKYQSRKLKNINFNDDMLCHWGVHHFHLGNTIEKDGFVSRTKELLFIYFTSNTAYIIGFFNHKSWCDRDVIEVLHNNWPEEIEKYKINISRAPSLTSEQYKNLRAAHYEIHVTTKDGSVYMPPGHGTFTTGDPVKGFQNVQAVFRNFKNDFEIIQNNMSQILESDPMKRVSEKITIGMRICHDSKCFIYKIKETGFEFVLK